MGKIFKSLQFWISVSIILVSLLVVLSMRLFWGDPGQWRGASKNLDLTSEQTLALREVFKKSHKSHDQLRSEIQSLENVFHKSISDPTKSKDDLEALFVKLDSLKSAMGKSRFDMTLKIREIIGAEKMHEFHKSHRPPRPRERGHRRPPPEHGNREGF